MRKILIFICFTIATLVVFGMFISATTYVQLAVAVATYPLLIYAAFVVFPRKNFTHALSATVVALQPPLAAQKTESVKTERISIADIDKRLFLKLLGGAGISFFLLSLFNKKTDTLFPGSVTTGSGMTLLKNTAGDKIDPAQSQPTDGYRISESDDNVISFYGFTNKDGAWYVMRQDVDTGSFRYSRGDSNFPGNWTNREKLKYDYFSNVFKP